ncbi:MAG: SGNH/GDSL hydrolase family protein [bacterium]
MKHLLSISLILFALALGLFSGCTDSVPSGPEASLGSNTITKYVAIGNSLTAGYQSGALYKSAQDYSYPNLIAQQLKVAGANLGSFEQPIYSNPGNPDATGKAAQIELISLTGPVIAPRGVAAGSPTNTALARPYDNLGIPGIPLLGFLDETGVYNGVNSGLGALVLRTTGGFPKSVYKQAQLLNPNLITFWLGANDVLGFATTGGTSPSTPTDKAIFTALYTQAFAALRTSFPNAKIVVGNIPDVKAVPFFTTVGPSILAKTGGAVTLYYQKRGETGVATGTSKLNESNAPFITLKGMSYASFLGVPNGQFYRDNKFPALPPGIDTTKPFGAHPQNPWPNALVLDSDEQTMATQAVADFNSAIATIAAANGAIVVDFFSIFNNIKANGYAIAGEIYKADFVTGALFSLDGVHPSSRGYGIVANEYIKKMNSSFGMTIPYVDISTIPGIPAPLAKAAPGQFPIIPADAFKSFDWLFKSSIE